MIATFAFIKKKQFLEAFRIASLLLGDEHDLVQKAVGWMLREIGKRDQAQLEAFLESRLKSMSRTTLRYAIERFPEEKRHFYLKK